LNLLCRHGFAITVSHAWGVRMEEQQKAHSTSVIQTCTTKYVQEEDRIALDSDLGAGHQARLWLTRRLTISLVDALEKSAKANTSSGLVRDDQKSMDQPNTKRAGQKKSEGQPVEISGDNHPTILVGTIKLKFVNAHAVLDFHGIADESYRFVLELSKLQIWLQQLRKIMSAAGWIMQQDKVDAEQKEAEGLRLPSEVTIH